MKTYLGKETILVKRYADENGTEEIVLSEKHKELVKELVQKKVI